MTVSEMHAVDVPDDLFQLAAQVMANCDPSYAPASWWADDMRAVFAAVLPVYEQQVRAGIVTELEAHAAECAALANGRPAHLVEHLANEATYFAAAARYVAADPEGRGDRG